jgi:hypothetical protein
MMKGRLVPRRSRGKRNAQTTDCLLLMARRGERVESSSTVRERNKRESDGR